MRDLKERLREHVRYQYMPREARETMEEALACIETLERERQTANEVLFTLYNVAAVAPYEPDEGRPHPLKDGIWDRAMRRASEHLLSFTPEGRALLSPADAGGE